MRLREAENEDTIKKLRLRLDEVEEEARRTRERVPEAAVAGLQVTVKDDILIFTVKILK